MNESILRRIVSGMLREMIEEFQLEEDVVVSRGESDRTNKASELTDEKTMEQKWAEAEDTGGDWPSNLGYVNNVDRGSSNKKF